MDRKEIFREIFLRLKNAFVLICIPLIFTVVFGMLYGKVFVEEIPLAVLDLDQSSLSRNIIKQFEDSPGFHVSYYAQSEIELEENMKRKTTYAGLIIPKDFSSDVKEMKGPKTLLLIDETNLVIGNNALAYGSTILNTLNAGVQLSVLEKKGSSMVPYVAEKAVTSLSFVERILYDPQLSYMKFLFFGIVGIFVQQTFLGVLAPLLIEEREKLLTLKVRSKDGIKKLASLGIRVLLIGLLAILEAALSFYIAHKYFALPLRGSLVYSFILLIIFIVNLTAISLFLAACFENVVHCVQFIMFLSTPTILTAGYIWPQFMMPHGFEHILSKVWPLIYYITPLRDMHLKGSGLNVIGPYIQGGIYFALLWVPIGIGAYLFRIYLTKKVRGKIAKHLPPEENKKLDICQESTP